jgi:hypothetical protein
MYIASVRKYCDDGEKISIEIVTDLRVFIPTPVQEIVFF